MSYPVFEILSVEKSDIKDTSPISPKVDFLFFLIHLLLWMTTINGQAFWPNTYVWEGV